MEVDDELMLLRDDLPQETHEPSGVNNGNDDAAQSPQQNNSNPSPHSSPKDAADNLSLQSNPSHSQSREREHKRSREVLEEEDVDYRQQAIECFGQEEEIEMLISACAENSEAATRHAEYLSAMQFLDDAFGSEIDFGLGMVNDFTHCAIKPDLQLKQMVEEEEHQEAMEKFQETFGEVPYDPAGIYGMEPILLQMDRPPSTMMDMHVRRSNLLRIPMLHPKRQILHFDPLPYDPKSETPKESNFRNIFTPENAIRNCVVDGDAGEFLSNARYVEWDNGDITLHLGLDTYTLHQKKELDPHVLFEQVPFKNYSNEPVEGAFGVTKAKNPYLCDPVPPSGLRKNSVDLLLALEKTQKTTANLPRLVSGPIQDDPNAQRPIARLSKKPPRVSGGFAQSLIPDVIDDNAIPIEEVSSRLNVQANLHRDFLRTQLKDLLKEIMDSTHSKGASEQMQLQASVLEPYQVLVNEQSSIKELEAMVAACKQITTAT